MIRPTFALLAVLGAALAVGSGCSCSCELVKIKTSPSPSPTVTAVSSASVPTPTATPAGGTPTATATATATATSIAGVPTPTATATSGAGSPTMTPVAVSPTATPTSVAVNPTPSMTPTIVPVVTPTPTNVPTPTATPTTVPVPPTISKAFSASSYPYETDGVFTITITNPNNFAITSVGVIDNMPVSPGQMAATSGTPTNVSGCGSSATFAGSNGNATSGYDTVTFSNGSIVANGTCSFTYTVTFAASGSYTNVTNSVGSSVGGGNQASATTTSEAPMPTVRRRR